MNIAAVPQMEKMGLGSGMIQKLGRPVVAILTCWKFADGKGSRLPLRRVHLRKIKKESGRHIQSERSDTERKDIMDNPSAQRRCRLKEIFKFIRDKRIQDSTQ